MSSHAAGSSGGRPHDARGRGATECGRRFTGSPRSASLVVAAIGLRRARVLEPAAALLLLVVFNRSFFCHSQIAGYNSYIYALVCH
jgi:hypothetical protein